VVAGGRHADGHWKVREARTERTTAVRSIVVRYKLLYVIK
jgi:hypothetical protein